MNRTELGRWIMRHTVLALAVLVVARGNIVDGITCENGLTLVAVIVIMSLLNVLLRPLILLVAMPLVIMSFGLLLLPALWVANATVLYVVGNKLGLEDFHVTTFGAAMWGSLWISIIAFLINMMIGGARGRGPRGPSAPGGNPGPADTRRVSDDKVIDI